MSNIQVLKSVGSDAFENLYDITIPPVSGITGADGINVRIKQIDIPESPSPSTYEVHYKTMKMTKSGSKIAQENELSFTMRVDKNWLAYKFFLEWKKLGFDQYSGVADEDLIPKVPIIVTTYDGSNNPTGGIWTFEDFYPIAVTNASFNQEGEAPIEVTIRGIFSVMDDSKII